MEPLSNKHKYNLYNNKPIKPLQQSMHQVSAILFTPSRVAEAREVEWGSASRLDASPTSRRSEDSRSCQQLSDAFVIRIIHLQQTHLSQVEHNKVLEAYCQALWVEISSLRSLSAQEASEQVLYKLNHSLSQIDPANKALVGNYLYGRLPVISSYKSLQAQPSVKSSAANYHVVKNLGQGDCGLYALRDSCSEELGLIDLEELRQRCRAALQRVSQFSSYLESTPCDLTNPRQLSLIRKNIAREQESLHARSAELSGTANYLSRLTKLSSQLNLPLPHGQASNPLRSQLSEFNLLLEPERTIELLLQITPNFGDLRFLVDRCLEDKKKQLQSSPMNPPSSAMQELILLQQELANCTTRQHLNAMFILPRAHQLLVQNSSLITIALQELGRYRLTSLGREGWLHSEDIRAMFLALGFVLESVMAANDLLGVEGGGGTLLTFINQHEQRRYLRNSARFAELNLGDYGTHWEGVIPGDANLSTVSQAKVESEYLSNRLPLREWANLDLDLRCLSTTYWAYSVAAKRCAFAPYVDTKLSISVASGVVQELTFESSAAKSLSLSSASDQVSYVLEQLFANQTLLDLCDKQLYDYPSEQRSWAGLIGDITRLLLSCFAHQPVLNPLDQELYLVLGTYNPILLDLLLQMKPSRKLFSKQTLRPAASKLLGVSYLITALAPRSIMQRQSIAYEPFIAWLKQIKRSDQSVPGFSKSDITSIYSNENLEINLGAGYGYTIQSAAELILNFMPSMARDDKELASYHQKYLFMIRRINKNVKLSSRALLIMSLEQALELNTLLLQGYQQRYELFHLELARINNDGNFEHLWLSQEQITNELYQPIEQKFVQSIKTLSARQDLLVKLTKLVGEIKQSLNAEIAQIYRLAYLDFYTNKPSQLAHRYAYCVEIRQELKLLVKASLANLFKLEEQEFDAHLAEFAGLAARLKLQHKLKYNLQQTREQAQDIHERYCQSFMRYFIAYTKLAKFITSSKFIPLQMVENLERALNLLQLLRSDISSFLNLNDELSPPPQLTHLGLLLAEKLEAALAKYLLIEVKFVAPVAQMANSEPLVQIAVDAPNRNYQVLEGIIEQLIVRSIPLGHLLPLASYSQQINCLVQLSTVDFAQAIRELPEELVTALELLNGMEQVFHHTSLDSATAYHPAPHKFWQISCLWHLVHDLRSLLSEQEQALGSLGQLESINAEALACQLKQQEWLVKLKAILFSDAGLWRMLADAAGGWQEFIQFRSRLLAISARVEQSYALANGDWRELILFSNELQRFTENISPLLTRLTELALNSVYQTRCATLIASSAYKLAENNLAAPIRQYLRDQQASFYTTNSWYLSPQILHCLELRASQLVIASPPLSLELLQAAAHGMSEVIAHRESTTGYSTKLRSGGPLDTWFCALIDEISLTNFAFGGTWVLSESGLLALTKRLPYNAIISILHVHLQQNCALSEQNRELLAAVFSCAAEFERIYLLQHLILERSELSTANSVHFRVYASWCFMSYKLLFSGLIQLINLEFATDFLAVFQILKPQLNLICKCLKDCVKSQLNSNALQVVTNDLAQINQQIKPSLIKLEQFFVLNGSAESLQVLNNYSDQLAHRANPSALFIGHQLLMFNLLLQLKHLFSI